MSSLEDAASGVSSARMSPEREEESAESNTSRDAIQRVVDGVVQGIRVGQLVPGQHLVENDLTRRFGVSRGSLREGLKRLEADGIVTLTRYRGAYISALDQKGVRDLLDVLEPLCSLAAKFAAENCRSDKEKAELVRLASEMGQGATVKGRSAYTENRKAFYDQLVSMGRNTELGRVIPLGRSELFRAQFEIVQTKAQRKKHSNGYVRIAEAVAQNDPAKAVRAVRKHFAGTRETLDVLPERAFSVAPM